MVTGKPSTRRKSVSLVMNRAHPAVEGGRCVKRVGRLQAGLGAQPSGILPQLARDRDDVNLRRGEN